ncbi:MAG: ribosome biogenesis GTPase Der [Actinobacteria bacterium]|nr:ribosome biogenesis GTPase Der [Actinomycetota bacterium]
MKEDIPKIAIIGKPNVGKSTLINRICQKREAIVHKEPMITRDRKYYTTDWNGINFYILDTGGIDFKSKERLSMQILLQAKEAIHESNLVIFLVDLTEPLSPLDKEVADLIRKSNKDLLFVGNKWDNRKDKYYTNDYLELGFGYPIKVSAMHGISIGDLLDEVIEKIKKYIVSIDVNKKRIIDEDISSISILGKPNVGKSTLFNTIIKEDRTIVDNFAGTTRDSIDSIITINNKKYRFIDTAGLKKNKLKEEDLEFYSKLRTIKTIEKSEVSLILIDCLEGISKQDIKIVEICLEKGVSVCVVFNKIDIVDKEVLKKMVDDFDKKLDFARFIPFLKISALNKKGITNIFKMIDSLIKERNKKVTEGKLIKLFKELEQQSAVYWKSKKFRVKFIKQLKNNPPYFLVFSNMDIRKKTNIIRFIENNIRKNFGFIGTPIFFKFKY